MKLLQDSDGNTSSKRVTAAGGFIVMAFITIYGVVTEQVTVANALWPWAVMVGALLGVTVLERKK